MHRGSGNIVKKRRVIESDDSDSNSESFARSNLPPPKSPKSPLMFRPRIKRPVPDSTTTVNCSKAEKRIKVSSSCFENSSKTMDNRLQLGSSSPKYRQAHTEIPGNRKPHWNTLQRQGESSAESSYKEHAFSSAAFGKSSALPRSPKTMDNRLKVESLPPRFLHANEKAQSSRNANVKQHAKKADWINAQKKDESFAGSSYKQNKFSSATSGKSSSTTTGPRYMQERRFDPRTEDEDDDEDDEADLSAIMQQVREKINNRRNAKKARIEKAFQNITAPDAWFEANAACAEERKKNYRKYESALIQFKTHTEAILKKHDNHKVMLHRMMDSISKGWSRLTQDTVKLKEEVNGCFERIAESRLATVKSIEKIGIDAVEKFQEELEDWEQYCMETIDEKSLQCLQSVVKFI